jgi:hypothetical protein
MNQATRHFHPVWAALCLLPLLTISAWANDFPTNERVLYVHECMRNNPGPHFEMVSKCSCALDKVASEVKFADYESMATVTNAVSIGGERGGTLRDNELLKPQVKRLRDLQAKARDACFIGMGPR